MKTHVTDEGEKECRAKTKESCRAKFNGEASPHFDNASDAREFREKHFASQNSTIPDPQKRKDRHAPATVVHNDLTHNDEFPKPQANRPERIAALVEAVHAGANDVESLKIALDVDERDARYYADAAGYLGLLHSTGNKEYEVTEHGEVLATSSEHMKEQLVSERIKGTPEYQEYVDGGEQAVKDMMSEETKLGDVTIARRTATARAWTDYVTDKGQNDGVATATELEGMRSRLEEAKENKRQRDEARRAAEEAAKPKVCPKHFMELSASGVCMMCD